MLLSQIGSYLFFGSLFGVIAIWSYFPRLLVMGWPVPTLFALALLGAILWFVFALDRMRLWVKKRSTQFGISLAVFAVGAVVLAGVVNWLAVSYNVKKDFTTNQIHTLSDQAKKIAGHLEEDILIRVWATSVDRMSPNLDMRKFFENFKIAGKGKIKLEIKNPIEDLTEQRKDQVKKENIIIVRSLKTGRENRIESFNDAKGEEQIVNAIVQVIKGRKKTLCFLQGQGQPSLANSEADGLSFVKTALGDSAYDTKEITLATAEKFPEECEAVVNVGPKGEALAREQILIENYLKGGGKLVALYGPGTPPSWRKTIAEYGVDLRSDLIVDIRVQPPIYMATKNYAQDVEIVRSFGKLVVFPEANSILVQSKLPEKVGVKTFVSSESYTYAKAGDLKALKSLKQTSADVKGPHALAVLITKPIETAPVSQPAGGGSGAAPMTSPKKPPAQGFFNKYIIRGALAQAGEEPEGMDEEMVMPGQGGAPDGPAAVDGPKDQKKETTIIAVGNHNFVLNAFIQQVGNMDFFMNSVSYLMKDQDLIGIRPKELRQASLELSIERLRMVIGTVLLLAIAFFVGGMIITGRRRAESQT